MTSTPSNGDGFKLGNIKVKGLYTPCHTQDSICWYMEDGDQKVVFTGDTLFHGGEFRRLFGWWLTLANEPVLQVVVDSSRARRLRCTRL